MEFEDFVAPMLALRPAERAVYSYLLRHSRMEDRPGVLIAAADLARAVGLLWAVSVRPHLFALQRKGCLRVKFNRRLRSYYVEVLLPVEIMRRAQLRHDSLLHRPSPAALRRHQPTRRAVHEREAGRCFYCRKRVTVRGMWLDHVVPHAEGGSTELDNIVASCARCNRRKFTATARGFLHQLRREGALTKVQLRARLKKLRLFLRGKLKLNLP
jgi:5-methylcytosine-specific restriction endonuclease McrA